MTWSVGLFPIPSPMVSFRLKRTLVVALFLCLGATELHATYYFRLGKQQFSLRNYTRALESFEKDAKARPGNGDSYFYIGYIHEREGRKLEAVNYYRRAVELRMDKDLKIKAFWKIVLHYKYHREWTNVAFYCRKFLEFRNLKQIRDLLEEAEKHHGPDQTRQTDLLVKAEQLMRDKKPEEAIGLLRQVLATDPGHRRALWDLAQSLISLSRYSEAISPLRSLVSASPEVWQYHYRLGLCYFRTQNPADAKTAYQLAAKHNPEGGSKFSHFIQLRLGDVHLSEADLNGAAEAYALAGKAQQSAELTERLAYLSWRTGDQAGAVRLANNAKGNDTAIADLVMLLHYATRRSTSAGQKAEQQLEQAQQRGDWLPPGINAARVLLAEAIVKKKDYKAALDVLGRVQTATFDVEADLVGTNQATLDQRFILATARALLGNNEASRASAILSTQSSPAALYLLARAYAAQNQTYQTIESLRRVFALKPEWHKRAQSEQDFRALAKTDETFRLFLAEGDKKTE